MRKTLVIAAASVLVATAATATATTLITGSQIKNGSIRAIDIEQGSITSDRLSPALRRKLDRIGTLSTGTAGSTGAPGSRGETGFTGATGATGAIGAKGDAGKNGTNGVNGATGGTGAQGPRGFNADGSVTSAVDVLGGPSGFALLGAAGTASIGNGALNLSNDGIVGVSAVKKAYPAMPKLNTLDSLVAKYARTSGAAATNVAVKIEILGATAEVSTAAANGAAPNSTLGATGYATLVYEVNYNDPALAAAGTVDIAKAPAKLWSTRTMAALTGGRGGAVDGTATLAAIAAANPNAVITSISIESGSSGGTAAAPLAMWQNFAGSVDFLNIGFAGEETVKYDFG